ncbi:hypothetical protein AVEN_155212-1 [Araneus ventricosus]|uniref:Uncharacterized protein n=1 Tax=Araneus ventricosus TaxID=182803 RepID=A0A4Y2EN45_ARAVE|nr:hypothetical protein AVEN_155212-1 [Araneus ventricosus]
MPVGSAFEASNNCNIINQREQEAIGVKLLLWSTWISTKIPTRGGTLEKKRGSYSTSRQCAKQYKSCQISSFVVRAQKANGFLLEKVERGRFWLCPSLLKSISTEADANDLK